MVRSSIRIFCGSKNVTLLTPFCPWLRYTGVFNRECQLAYELGAFGAYSLNLVRSVTHEVRQGKIGCAARFLGGTAFGMSFLQRRSELLQGGSNVVQCPDFLFGSSSWGWVLYHNQLRLSQIRCHPVARRSKKPRNWEWTTNWMVELRLRQVLGSLQSKICRIQSSFNTVCDCCHNHRRYLAVIIMVRLDTSWLV